MKIIDITYPIHIGMFKYPNDPEPEIERRFSEIEEVAPPVVDNAIRQSYGHRGAWESFIKQRFKSGYVLLTMRNHLGTHVDAPAHKIEGGKTIGQYSIDKFVNKCVLIDLTSENVACRDKDNKGFTTGDLAGKVDFQYLKEDGITAVLFYTGFCDRIAEMDGKLTGKDKTNFEGEFTYMDEETAQYIASNAPFLNIAGIDSFAFDPSGSNSQSHRAFFGNDTLLLETAVNLKELRDAVGNKPFELNCVPLLYKEADAAQTRAYAKIGGTEKIKDFLVPPRKLGGR